MTRALLLAFTVASLSCHSSSSGSADSGAVASTPLPDASAVPASPRSPIAAASLLDADLRARLELARAQLGPLAPSHIEADVFLLLGSSPGPFFDKSMALVHKALAAYFDGRFVTRPTRAVSVYIFPDRPPFDAYCRARFGAACPSRYGFYRKDTREVFVNAGPGVETLAHELVHPIVEADFPTAPAWLNEGLGALYEAPVFGPPGEIQGRRINWRYARLRAARSAPSERDRTRLDALFATTDAEFHDDDALGYAVARSACRWLDEQHLLWPFYRAWREAAADDPRGAKVFAGVTGKTPEEAEGKWEEWLGGL